MALALQPVPTKSAVLPKVRLPERVRKAFSRQAKRAGVSESEALRQVLAAYLRRPVALDEVDAALDTHLPPVRVPAELAAGARLEAARQGLALATLVRRVVARQVG